jgi:tetratricopeptide (TPR) repeat protein
MITLKARGNFRLSGDGGEDITPSSMKARGLIALLALAPDHVRRRAWLQDKLWSESDHRHGADSLRQTLTLVRRALGTRAHALRTNRRTVSLDSTLFRVDYERAPAGIDTDTDGELFADLDVPDPEFESWIRDKRSEFGQRLDPAARSTNPASRADEPAIVFHARDIAHGELIQTAISLATASLLDIADFTIFHDDGMAGQMDSALPPSQGVRVSLSVSSHISPPELHVALCNLQTGRVLSQSHFALGRRGYGVDPEDIYRASVGLVEAILAAFKSWQGDLQIKDCSAMLVNRARHLLFRFDKHSLATADHYLQRAYHYESKPQYLAWRALVRSMAEFQHRTTGFLGDSVDSGTLVQEAIAEAPDSAIALGMGAHIEYLSGGSQRSAMLLAKRAVDRDPLNGVNHAILSNLQLVLGDRQESYRSALTAVNLVGNGSQRAFVEFFCCMAASSLGNYTAAIDHAEAALVLRPFFPAPLRYLIALYTHEGRWGDLERALIRLRVLEPDFEPARLLEQDYPVITLRRLPLIGAIRD